MNLTTQSHKKIQDAKEEFAFNAETEIVDGRTSIWFLDSGATEHLARLSEKLENLKALRNPIQIHVAKSGHKLLATECGELKVRT